MISVQEAQKRILSAFSKLPSEDVSLEMALGRILTSDVRSRRSQPPVSVSSMDGYAVRSLDLNQVPHKLTQVGSAPAGTAFEGKIGKNETVRIFTGGPVPAGSDAVVIQENTIQDKETITIKVRPKKGQYIRVAGLDFKNGDIGVTAGKVISARDIALMAAMDYPWLTVRRKPRIAILATGDEIVRPGEPIGPNQIVSSNALALSGIIKASGGEAVNLGIAPDQTEILQFMADGARGFDLLVTSGGISVGEHDLVRSALEQVGLEMDFWKVAMRPGKPVMFGKLDSVPILGLPGNPVSVIVCALVFLLPILKRLSGFPAEELLNTQNALLNSGLDNNDERQDYLRATLDCRPDGTLWVTPFKKQDSSMLSLLAKADCLLVREPHAGSSESGDEVDIIRFPNSLTNI